MKTHIVSTRKGEVDLYIHHCFKCNYMKYEDHHGVVGVKKPQRIIY